MLNPDRKHFVTASQCHRVMAGFETELAGKDTAEPSRIDVLKWIEINKRSPKVGEIKAVDIIASGAEIKEAFDYYRSQIKVFSEGMESVAREIAMHSFFKIRDESYKSQDMERGNIQEGEAIIALSERTGKVFTSVEQGQSFLTSGNLGVTPDGVEMDGFNYKSCAEVKNPKDTTHMAYLHQLRTQEDMLKVCSNYYWQAQCGLHVTGAETYEWASYHNGADFNDGSDGRPRYDYRLAHLQIKPVQSHIDMLIERADRVIDRVPAIIESIKSRYEGDLKNG